jgi:stress-induced morphogen
MSDTKEAIRTAILMKIPDAAIVVDAGSGGHFTIQVVSPIFSGKNMVESQRLVYGAIAHLMKGDGAPVHAIDKLTTKTPP